MRRVSVWLVIIVLLLLFSALNFWNENQKADRENRNFRSFPKKLEEEAIKTVKIGGVILNVEVADTSTERIKGLSGKEELSEDEGMLFVFDKEGYYGIWMKEMNFPIDIVWLDKNKKIIHVENAASPETYPKAFTSSSPALYVLETSANFFKSHKIKIGDIAEF